MKVSQSAQINTAHRHTALTPHQSHDRWPLLLLEIDTCTIINFIKNSWGGPNGSNYLYLLHTCDGKSPNFHHEMQ